METYTLTVKVKVPFDDKDKNACKGIKKWIKDTLEDECSCIPLYAESINEDYAKQIKIKVKVKHEKNNQRGSDGVGHWWMPGS